MDLPYSLLCLAHGSHKVHNRKYCEEWLGLGQRPGGTLVYYQEGLLQVKKICQRLIIKVRKHKNAGILLCLATSVRLMGIRLYSWNSANRTNIPARDSISYPKRQLPFANFFFSIYRNNAHFTTRRTRQTILTASVRGPDLPP